MKPFAKSKQAEMLESVDGPPLDFSFKGLRSLEQLKENNQLKLEAVESQQKQNPQVSNLLADDPINEEGKERTQAKLQIIRTIDTGDHQFLEQQQNKIVTKKKKIQKTQKRHVIPQTTALFLRYNKITSIEGLRGFIEPIFLNMDNLMWIDLSHNRLAELCEDLGSFKNLKTLYLHANYISAFKQLQKLKGAELLRTITIHGNPIEEYEQFRIILQSILPSLKKIDSTLVTKRETERSAVLMKSMKKYPVIKNPKKPPQESDNQQET